MAKRHANPHTTPHTVYPGRAMSGRMLPTKSPAPAPAPPKAKGPAHPGFAVVQNKIAAQQGVSRQAAGAMLAASTRNASPKAKAKNPALKKVRGKGNKAK